MKRWLLFVTLFSTVIMADYTSRPIDSTLLNSKIKIIDIRTPSEWRSTGLVKNSIPIMFFDEQGNYNMNAFLKELHKHVKKKEKFALICHTGNRSSMLGQHLADNLGYNVINLEGGIVVAFAKKLPIKPYNP